MRQNFPASVSLVLRSEGGFADNPLDSGGATNFGITRATLSNWLRHPASVADVQALSVDTATAIYQASYWNAIKGDSLPLGIDYAVFDEAVNSGPSKAAKDLQSVLGVPVDGVIGPVTLAAAAKAEPVGVINALCDARMAFLKSLATWATFGAGWSTRVAAVRAAAIAMLATAPAQPFPPLPAPTPLPKPSPAPLGIWQAVLAIFNAILALLNRKV